MVNLPKVKSCGIRGGEKLNKKWVCIIVFLITAILCSNLSLALATTVQTDYENAGASCINNVPGQPEVRIVVYGQMYGDYYSGNNHADRIQILLKITSGPSIGSWKYIVGYEDNPTRSAFSDSLGLGTVENVVKYGQIQMLRDEDNNINTVHWNIPLVCPATDNTPAVTLPPGKLMLQGYGDLKTNTPQNNAPIGETGWTYSLTGHYYSATAKFFCVDWNCKWITVGEGYASNLSPRAQVDRVWTWNHG